MNKNVIIAILIIIIIAVVGIFGFGLLDGKTGTQINFVNGDHIKNGESVTHSHLLFHRFNSEDHIKNGESVTVELKDSNGKAITNQIVNFTYNENNTAEKFSVYTDSQGKAYLNFAGEKEGQYEITASYGGNDTLKPCTASQKITVVKGNGTETPTESNSTASTMEYNKKSEGSTQTYYDAELGLYYDGNGKVIGGQHDGANIYELREHPPFEADDGDFV